MLVLNLKTYAESTGLNCKRLLDIVDDYITKNPNIKDRVVVAVSSTDLFWAKQSYPNLIIAAQHVDNVNVGSTTGWIPAETIMSYGIEYAIFNHSEHRINSDSLLEDIKDIQEKGLRLIVCCENLDEARRLVEIKPFAMAYEPKDLIGSGISVTTRPDAVKAFMEVVAGKTNALIGAGVSTGEDVTNSVALGAEGVLLASAFVKATDPFAKLGELVQPFA